MIKSEVNYFQEQVIVADSGQLVYARWLACSKRLLNQITPCITFVLSWKVATQHYGDAGVNSKLVLVKLFRIYFFLFQKTLGIIFLAQIIHGIFLPSKYSRLKYLTSNFIPTAPISHQDLNDCYIATKILVVTFIAHSIVDIRNRQVSIRMCVKL